MTSEARTQTWCAWAACGKPKTLFSLFVFFQKKKKKLKETGLQYYPKNQENKASHSSTDLEGKYFWKKKSSKFCVCNVTYNFEVMRSEKKLLSFSSTVNFLYSGHCRDLELLSSLARVRYSGNLFQSNICNLWKERENGDPNLPPFPPSFLPSSLHPLPFRRLLRRLHFMVLKKSKNLLVLWCIHDILKTAH